MPIFCLDRLLDGGFSKTGVRSIIGRLRRGKITSWMRRTRKKCNGKKRQCDWYWLGGLWLVIYLCSTCTPEISAKYQQGAAGPFSRKRFLRFRLTEIEFKELRTLINGSPGEWLGGNNILAYSLRSWTPDYRCSIRLATVLHSYYIYTIYL